MIVERDKEIINFIDKIGYATINSIAKMFFTNKNYAYDLARKRLKKISECNRYIKSLRNWETNEVIYLPYESKVKRVSIHNLKVLDYICTLKTLGCKITDVEMTPTFDKIIPDAFVKFEFNNEEYNQIIEVQIRHDFVDLKKYENENVVNTILERTDTFVPDLIIVQNTNKIYEEDNNTVFKIGQLGLDLQDIAKVLLI